MEKTAVQDIIDLIDSITEQREELKPIREFALKLKVKEQKQITDAWYDGASSDPLPTHHNAEKYYEKKYGNN